MATTAVEPKRGNATVLKVVLGLLLLVGAGVALAWLGVQSVRGRTVQVETIRAGSGPAIAPVDGVIIDYEGRLTDGTVFDSSAGKGPIPVIVGQMIPGFAEALTRMQKGGKYRVRIPSKLAYGATPPAGGPIPPNADLDFDVEVHQVVPNAASMMQGAPQQ